MTASFPGSPGSGATGALLAEDRIDRFRAAGARGKPAYQSHVQLRAMLRAQCGDEVANLFARPNFNADTGVLSWTAEVPGMPQRWDDLAGAARDQASLRYEVIRSSLSAFADELRARRGSGAAGAAAFAELLEQAMQIPAEGGDFLQFIDGQPVISFWGFQNADGQSAWPLAQPLPLPPQTGEAVNSTGARAAAAGVAAGTVGVTVVERRRRWWWLLLLLLVLLLLLAWLLRACAPAVVTGGLPGVDPRVSGPAPDDRRPNVEGPMASRPDTATLPNGLSDGRIADGGTGGSVLPPAGPDAGPAGAMPPPGADSAPNATLPLDDKDQQRNPDPDKDPNKNPGPDPNRDPGKADQQDPSKDPRKDPQKNPDKDQKPLQMPDKGNGKPDFLKGDWQAGDNIYDGRTGQPLDIKLKFDDSGKGTLTMRRPDGSTCSGPVQGSMNGGKLGITGDSVPCQGGGSYTPPRIECGRDSAGQTKCKGLNKNGGDYDLDIHRQGP